MKQVSASIVGRMYFEVNCAANKTNRMCGLRIAEARNQYAGMWNLGKSRESRMNCSCRALCSLVA